MCYEGNAANAGVILGLTCSHDVFIFDLTIVIKTLCFDENA